MPPHKNSLALVRVWFEAGSDPPMRIRVRLASDVSAPAFATQQTVASIEAASQLLTAWLEELKSAHAPPPG